MSVLDTLRLFYVRNAALLSDLDAVARKYDVALNHRPVSEKPADADYYPQLPLALRSQAAAMSKHYETFYVLENYIRELVTETLREKHGVDWWDKHVSQSVKDNVEKNRRREAETGVTLRSLDAIDYTTFGELSQIVQENWSDFADTFNNRSAFIRILAGLNMLRAPIAHCSVLAPDEVLRLDLSIRDYFRLMQ